MILKLIIGDLDFNLLCAWSKVLQGIPEIVFLNVDFQAIAKNPEVKAILLKNIFAYERYGVGMPKIGESEVLSTCRETGMPPWVVATPFFSKDVTYAPEEYDYIEFSRVFESIKRFNKTDKKPKIETLGFQISFLYGLGSTIPDKKEPEGLRRAYLQYCHQI